MLTVQGACALRRPVNSARTTTAISNIVTALGQSQNGKHDGTPGGSWGASSPNPGGSQA